MKEMNPLETQLRSWAPRPPSAKLKRTLFAETAPLRPHAGFNWQWLAPAAACLLFALTVFNQHGELVNGVGTGDSIMLVSSNLSPQLFAQDTLQQSKRNNLANRIEWTNGGAFTSSVTSFLPGQVN
ncbi:MAG: hypothetical protein H7Y43_01535 [Akkermansiaceae bacterium]|nr:hypothetical protein [Verrucomicrobiales bacterium]